MILTQKDRAEEILQRMLVSTDEQEMTAEEWRERCIMTTLYQYHRQRKQAEWPREDLNRIWDLRDAAVRGALCAGGVFLE